MADKSQEDFAWYSVLWRGMAMGSAFLVPGVSGGAVALITHIYARFINVIAQLSVFPKYALQVRSLNELQDTIKRIDLRFLGLLGAGIVFAVSVMSGLLTQAIQEYPQILISFFCGLILATAISLYVQSGGSRAATTIFILGAMAGLAITHLPFLGIQANLLATFVLGVIAFSVMLLPGVSGSYVLLISGQYEMILSAIRTPLVSLNTIILFALGGVLGLGVSSNLIQHVLSKYKQQTYAALAGIMLGTLRTPLQSITSATTNEPIGLVFIASIVAIALVLWLEIRRVRDTKH